jgi:hypothetical protein
MLENAGSKTLPYVDGGFLPEVGEYVYGFCERFARL